MDSTGTLDAAQRSALEAKLTAFEQSRGAQVVVLIVPTTQPEDIAAYAQRVGDTWKIGRKSIGDGLLLVVAKNDRKVRIETTKALEGAIPDLAARQVIDTAITPRFKQGDYAGGLDAAADQLIALISGENLPATGTGRRRRQATTVLNGPTWRSSSFLPCRLPGVSQPAFSAASSAPSPPAARSVCWPGFSPAA
jgi:uncharacterized protein